MIEIDYNLHLVDELFLLVFAMYLLVNEDFYLRLETLIKRNGFLF